MAKKLDPEVVREAKELSLSEGQDMKIVWNREARRWEIFRAYEPILGGSGGGWQWPWEKHVGIDLTKAGFYDLPFAIVRNGKLTTIL